MAATVVPCTQIIVRSRTAAAQECPDPGWRAGAHDLLTQSGVCLFSPNRGIPARLLWPNPAHDAWRGVAQACRPGGGPSWRHEPENGQPSLSCRYWIVHREKGRHPKMPPSFLGGNVSQHGKCVSQGETYQTDCDCVNDSVCGSQVHFCITLTSAHTPNNIGQLPFSEF